MDKSNYALSAPERILAAARRLQRVPLPPAAPRVQGGVRRVPVDHPASSASTEETDHVR
jgi:hypothetical protein